MIKTLATLLVALIVSTGSAWASRHSAPAAASSFVDIAAVPAYAFDRPGRVATAPRQRAHYRTPVRHLTPRQRHPYPADGATVAQREPLSAVPAKGQSDSALKTGAFVGVAEGWADGIATAVSHAVGGCGVSFQHNLVDCRSGASTSVSSAMLPHAQCLLRWLDAVGYPVRDIGGYGERHNPSAHPTGNALDVNQLSRNVVSARFPAGVTDAASRCGLVHGAVWNNPDTGHFEMLGKYGYTGFTRYARRSYVRYAHHHRRHYAGA